MLDERLIYVFLCIAIQLVWWQLNRRLALAAARRHAHWEPTTGQVVQLARTGKGILPVVGYYIAGQAVRGAPILDCGDIAVKVGQAVSILYDPEHPDHILLKRQLERDGKLGVIYGAGVVALMVLLLGKYYFTYIV